MRGVPRIRCAVCNRDVDSVTVWTDFGTNVHTVVVKCHGQTDKTVVTDWLLDEYGSDQFATGVAFNQVRIGNK